MLFELRQYRIKPGQMDNWVKLIAPQVDEMLDRERGLSVTLMEPSPLSIIR